MSYRRNRYIVDYPMLSIPRKSVNAKWKMPQAMRVYIVKKRPRTIYPSSWLWQKEGRGLYVDLLSLTKKECFGLYVPLFYLTERRPWVICHSVYSYWKKTAGYRSPCFVWQKEDHGYMSPSLLWQKVVRKLYVPLFTLTERRPWAKSRPMCSVTKQWCHLLRIVYWY